MAKLFEAQLQLIVDDKQTVAKVERLLEAALKHLKISGDIIVQPCGTIDDIIKEDNEEDD